MIAFSSLLSTKPAEVLTERTPVLFALKRAQLVHAITHLLDKGLFFQVAPAEKPLFGLLVCPEDHTVVQNLLGVTGQPVIIDLGTAHVEVWRGVADVNEEETALGINVVIKDLDDDEEEDNEEEEGVQVNEAAAAR